MRPGQRRARQAWTSSYSPPGYRWAEGQTERLDALATELVRLKVNLIVTHNTPPILAAKHATSVIPMREVRRAAGTFGLEVTTFEIRRVEDLASAFATFERQVQA